MKNLVAESLQSGLPLRTCIPIRYTAGNRCNALEVTVDVRALRYCPGDYRRRTTGGRPLSDIPGQDQGGLPSGGKVLACRGAGPYAVDVVDRGGVPVCRGRERLQEWLCGSLDRKSTRLNSSH